MSRVFVDRAYVVIVIESRPAWALSVRFRPSAGRRGARPAQKTYSWLVFVIFFLSTYYYRLGHTSVSPTPAPNRPPSQPVARAHDLQNEPAALVLPQLTHQGGRTTSKREDRATFPTGAIPFPVCRGWAGRVEYLKKKEQQCRRSCCGAGMGARCLTYTQQS